MLVLSTSEIWSFDKVLATLLWSMCSCVDQPLGGQLSDIHGIISNCLCGCILKVNYKPQKILINCPGSLRSTHKKELRQHKLLNLEKICERWLL